MATIKEGYDGQPLEIKVYARPDDRKTELWIGQFDEWKYKERDDDYIDENKANYRTETLAFITIQEAIALRDELNVAIKEMAGL